MLVQPQVWECSFRSLNCQIIPIFLRIFNFGRPFSQLNFPLLSLSLSQVLFPFLFLFLPPFLFLPSFLLVFSDSLSFFSYPFLASSSSFFLFFPFPLSFPPSLLILRPCPLSKMILPLSFSFLISHFPSPCYLTFCFLLTFFIYPIFLSSVSSSLSALSLTPFPL
jgi:hypothetical protein